MSDHKPCPDCDGRGFNYSDPDRKLLVCGMCGGDGELEEAMSKKYSTDELEKIVLQIYDILHDLISNASNYSQDLHVKMLDLRWLINQGKGTQEE